MSVRPRPHSTNLYSINFPDKWVSLLPYRTRQEARDSFASGDTPTTSGNTAPTSESSEPASDDTAPTSESTQTVNSTGSFNQESKPEAEPGGSGSDFASRETGQRQQDEECLPADQSSDARSLLRDFAFLWPQAHVEAEDMCRLLRTSGRTKEELSSILWWLKKECNGSWKDDLQSSAEFVRQFDIITKRHMNHMAVKQKSARSGRKGATNTGGCTRRCREGRLMDYRTNTWTACDCSIGNALPEKSGEIHLAERKNKIYWD